MTNPFIFGSPVPPDTFINHEIELRSIAGRILDHGQPTALISEPRFGKTSLLHYLMSPPIHQAMQQLRPITLLYQYLDADLLEADIRQEDFWEFAFQPVAEWAAQHPDQTALQKLISECKDKRFAKFSLERLLRQMSLQKIRLVLLLDEFDLFLAHSVLSRTEFFGGLRSLTSLSKGALVPVIASRLGIKDLNARTEGLSLTSSPFFNIFYELTLGMFSPVATNKLLDRAGERFEPADQRFIMRIAGGHPFLIQVAAYLMWQAYENGITGVDLRWEYVAENLFAQADPMMADTWRVWDTALKQTMVTIALNEIPCLLGKKRFDIDVLNKKFKDFGPEVSILRRKGYIVKTDLAPLNLQITAEVMIWWLAHQLILEMRSKDELGKWLADQQWEGILKAGEIEQIQSAAIGLGQIVKDSISTFVKAAAEGLGKGMAGK